MREYEPHLALDGGADGLKFYRAIAARWKEALLPGGRLLFELGIGEADAVMRLLRSEGSAIWSFMKIRRGFPG